MLKVCSALCRPLASILAGRNEYKDKDKDNYRDKDKDKDKDKEKEDKDKDRDRQRGGGGGRRVSEEVSWLCCFQHDIIDFLSSIL